jgi:RecA-family ATPase
VADNIGAFPDLQTAARLLGGTINGDQILAPGPRHSATDKSLSVKIDANAQDGFVVNSFSGDDPMVCRDYVREKLGLPAFEPNGGNRQHATEDFITRAVMAAAMAQGRDGRPKGRIIAAYHYTDVDNKLLYQVLRYQPKEFRQRRPDGDGGWIWKLDDSRVVYRWPELLKFPDATVFVCEGEKDVDRIAELGHCATTVAAGNWTDECIQALEGRNILILEDNDDAGRKKARKTAEALHGVANTIRIVSLPDLPERGDVSDWLDADPHRANKLTDVCFDAPLWTPIGDTAETTADAKTEKPSDTSAPALPFIDIAAWKDQPVPERQWIVKNRIPANNVTLLSGEGSVGKSILSLHLAVAVALGRDWLGSLPEPGPALVACCEDDADELWRRLDLIFQHFGAAYTDFKDLHVIALAGGETLMAAPDRHGLIKITKLFENIRGAACDLRPKLIVLDNAADIYGGNENDRAQVRQFVGILRGMAMAAGAGVLLTSHPSLTGINTGTGLSGSTAWNASVRSRLYFKRATTDKDEEPDPDLRVLEVMKANYGPIGETITVRWTNGLFLPVGGASHIEKAAAKQAAERLFLTLLARFTRQGRIVSDKPTSHGYAPNLFAADPEARSAHIGKSALADAMQRLFAADEIHVESYGRPSRLSFKLVLGKGQE